VPVDEDADPAVKPAAAPDLVFPPFPKMESVYSGYFRTRITRKTAEELKAEYERSS
jgi:hypothetical protein